MTPEQAAELAVELEDLAANQPRHPGIAAALAAGVEGTTPYLAQEYVAGEALDAALRQFGAPPPAEALTTLRRVADALDRAAGEGIHHGMLHPRDILIAEGGEARVIDLGVAQALARSGLRVPVRRPYSAPERASDDAWGGPADIYSLGAIASELLTGRRLSGTGTPDLQGSAVPAAVVEQVGQVLARALDADPQARYPSAADLVDALAALLPHARRSPRKRARAGADLAMPLPLGATAANAEFPVDAGDVSLDRGVAPDADLPELDTIPAPGPEPVVPLLIPADDGPAPRFTSLDGEQERAHPSGRLADAPKDVPEVVPGPASWVPSIDSAPPAAERRPLLPLLLPLLVGIAAGFGWGYWTAYRSLSRPAADIAASRDAAPTAEGAGSAVRVDEPEVIGERGLPSPAATPQRPVTAPPQSAPAGPRSAPAPPPAARPPAAAPAARAQALPKGRLVVRSTPAGARVRLDGRVRGRTPLTLGDLPLRVVRVTIERDGYTADERRVALTAARPTVTVEARLAAIAPPRPEATSGVLVVDSRPAGATVFVDGRQVGTTPMVVPDTAPGTHRIRLELAGFTPWVTTAQVKAGERTRVAASLERGTPE